MTGSDVADRAAPATLAIIGAGAKAVSVAAKAAELRAMGVEVPDVVAVERSGVAANWQADGGWTDGQHRLGTSPEKDVGFPYRSSLAPRRNAELDERMTRHSWQSYLIGTGGFAEWVDRGRPAPTHRRWSQYLRWVADNIGMTVIAGEVSRISVDNSADGRRWALHTSERTVHADAVMISGPGQAERSILPGNPRVLSIAQFWQRAARHDLLTAERVAVAGGGETAASMLNELFRHRPRPRRHRCHAKTVPAGAVRADPGSRFPQPVLPRAAVRPGTRHGLHRRPRPTDQEK